MKQQQLPKKRQSFGASLANWLINNKEPNSAKYPTNDSTLAISVLGTAPPISASTLNLETWLKDPTRLPFLQSYLANRPTYPLLLFLLDYQNYICLEENSNQRDTLAAALNEKYIDSTSAQFPLCNFSQSLAAAIAIPEDIEVKLMAIATISKEQLLVSEWDSFCDCIENQRSQNSIAADCDEESSTVALVVTPDNNGQDTPPRTPGKSFFPLENVLKNPRAAHFFLLFLMQLRQHFELYFWLHVEYVLKPLVLQTDFSSSKFWNLARNIESNVQKSSQAIQYDTKQELQYAVLQLDANAVLLACTRAQEEVFNVLSSIWYPRFLSSSLYNVLCQELSVLNPTTPTLDVTKVQQLDLASIIRSTTLPEGLQVHYRPHYALQPKSLDRIPPIVLLHCIISFEAIGTGENMECQLFSNSSTPSNSDYGNNSNIISSVKPFFVPDGRYVILSHDKAPKSPIVFPFVQYGKHSPWYGAVYLTYCDNHTVAKGYCVLSEYPVVDSLIETIQTIHHRQSLDTSYTIQDFLYDQSHPSSHPTLYIDTGASSSDNYYNNEGIKSLKKNETTLESLDFSIEILFKRLGIPSVLKILAAVMLERNIMLVSSQYTKLTVVGEALKSLISPLTWCHIYCPVLPKSLLTVLHSPAPFLVGLCNTYYETLYTEGITGGTLQNQNLLIVDLDHGVVDDNHCMFTWRTPLMCRSMRTKESEGEFQPLVLPIVFENARDELEGLLRVKEDRYDDSSSIMEDHITGDNNQLNDFPEVSVRLMCQKLVSSLIENHSCASLVVGDMTESVVIFDTKKFMSMHPTDEHSFIKQLVKTQGFSELLNRQQADTLC